VGGVEGNRKRAILFIEGGGVSEGELTSKRNDTKGVHLSNK
jgi:hypothetical protein